MLTDKDIQKLKTVFATKDDFKGFATKDDLKDFATKDDLKGFATKDDLKGFATKDDFEYLKVKVSNIESIVIKLDEKIEKIDKRDFEDSSALASTVLDHDRRIKVLERYIKA